MSNNQRPESPPPAKQSEKFDYLNSGRTRGQGQSRVGEVRKLAKAIKKNLGLQEQLDPVSSSNEPESDDNDRQSPATDSPSSPCGDRASEHAEKMFNSRKRERGHIRAPTSEDVDRVSPPAAFSAAHLPRLNVAEVTTEISSPRPDYSPRVEYLESDGEPSSLQRISSFGVIPSPGTAFSPRQ